MYVNLSKKFITHNLLIYLDKSSFGRLVKVPIWKIVRAIIYRLKTGCQWRELPLQSLFGKKIIRWQSVYYHFKKWSKDGSWKRIWIAVLKARKYTLDMSSVQLDGSHTPAKRGGEAVGYQGRKKCKTTNALFLTDKQGIPLAMSNSMSGNHHDVFDIKNNFQKMLDDLQLSEIPTVGLFINADAGFDAQDFRNSCSLNDIIPNVDFNKRNSKNVDYEHSKDDLLYKERFCVERTNAWLYAFKAILTRFETRTDTWMALHFLAFALILIKKTF